MKATVEFRIIKQSSRSVEIFAKHKRYQHLAKNEN